MSPKLSTPSRARTVPLRAARSLVSLGAFLAACSGQVTPPIGLSDQPGTPNTPGTPGVPGADAGRPGMTQAPLDCASLHVGYTPLQRLSKDQYTSALRDLLGIQFDASMLSDDERVGVFDGNVVAPVTDLLVDEYASAAERAAQLAAPNLEKLVSCDRAKDGDDACAARFVATLGKRVYRRPLASEEQQAYVQLFGAYKARGYTTALRVIVQTMLQSPNFLYRVELQPLAPGQAEGVTLDAHELASRLSFFLLGTTPDDALLDAAGSGALLTDEGLLAQTERLLEHAHFSDTLARFHTHWLELNKLPTLTKDDARFPAFTPALATQMLDETIAFADHVIRKDDARLETLLTASYGFPRGELATLYGVTPAATPEQPVQLDPTQRAGLLTKPAFLAAHAHYDSTSPVERGKVVIRNVLCQQLPDPPANVNTTPPDPSADATLREALLEHQNNASCVGCHKRIDGIGLGFEQWDAIGAYRREENGKPVDSSGEIVQVGADVNGTFANAGELVNKLADSTALKQCVATQWLRYALGRLETGADACALDTLFREFEASDHDLRELMRQIALSDVFRHKRVSP